MVRGLSGRLALPDELKKPLEKIASNGRSSRELLRLFEAHGEFYVDRRGPWLRLPLIEGEWGATGVSRSQILAGDPRVAVLVLAAVIDHNLHQSDARREDIEYVDGLMTLFRQASHTIGRQARGAGKELESGSTGVKPMTSLSLEQQEPAAAIEGALPRGARARSSARASPVRAIAGRVPPCSAACCRPPPADER